MISRFGSPEFPAESIATSTSESSIFTSTNDVSTHLIHSPDSYYFNTSSNINTQEDYDVGNLSEHGSNCTFQDDFTFEISSNFVRSESEFISVKLGACISCRSSKVKCSLSHIHLSELQSNPSLRCSNCFKKSYSCGFRSPEEIQQGKLSKKRKASRNMSKQKNQTLILANKRIISSDHNPDSTASNYCDNNSLSSDNPFNSSYSIDLCDTSYCFHTNLETPNKNLPSLLMAMEMKSFVVDYKKNGNTPPYVYQNNVDPVTIQQDLHYTFANISNYMNRKAFKQFLDKCEAYLLTTLKHSEFQTPFVSLVELWKYVYEQYNGALLFHFTWNLSPYYANTEDVLLNYDDLKSTVPIIKMRYAEFYPSQIIKQAQTENLKQLTQILITQNRAKNYTPNNNNISLSTTNTLSDLAVTTSIPCLIQVNTAFENFLGYSQHEIRELFMDLGSLGISKFFTLESWLALQLFHVKRIIRLVENNFVKSTLIPIESFGIAIDKQRHQIPCIVTLKTHYNYIITTSSTSSNNHLYKGKTKIVEWNLQPLIASAKTIT